MRLRTRLADAALLLGAVAVAGFAIRRGINPHDEGLMLAAADRIVRGELPWRDFWWNYGPAEPFLLAGLQELFGRSLLVWRIVHVLVAAVGAWLAYRLVRREAPLPLALASWMTIAAVLSFPLLPNPVGPALVLALAGLALAPRHAVLAGICAGLALMFRLDVGAAALLAVALAAPSEEDRGRTLVAAGATALLVYVPLAIAAGPGRLLDQTIGFALFDQSRQRLPLPFDAGGTNDLNKVFEHLFPTLALTGLALWIAVVAVRWARGAGPPGGLPRHALPLAVAGAFYVLARADEFHVVLLAATLPLLASPIMAAELAEPRRRWPTLLSIGIVLALPLAYGLDRKGVQLIHPPELSTIGVAVADGVQAEPSEAHSLAALARYVDRTTMPGEPVFVANPRHDLVRVGNPLVSVLIDRPNPTAYPIMQPGVVTERGVQAQIVVDLEQARTRMVIRWCSPIADEQEPNGAGRSTGVRLLDRYLTAGYRPRRRFGDYQVLMRAGALRRRRDGTDRSC